LLANLKLQELFKFSQLNLKAPMISSTASASQSNSKDF
jgi:hypothetical protein